MRKLIVLVCMLTIGFTQAQEVKPTYEREGDLVKVTYFYKNGNVKQQGFFKDKKLTGTWTSFDENGNKTAVARYKSGKKDGKWFVVTNDGLKEIMYKNNVITSVKTSYGESNVAIK